MRAEPDRRLSVVVEPVERALLDGVQEFENEPDRVRIELAVVPVFADERPLVGMAGLLDWRACGRLSALLRSEFFTGQLGEQLLTLGERRWPVDRLVLVGAGPQAEFDEARARALGARCVEIASGLTAATVMIVLPSVLVDRGTAEVAFEALLEALSRRDVAAKATAEPDKDEQGPAKDGPGPGGRANPETLDPPARAELGPTADPATPDPDPALAKALEPEPAQDSQPEPAAPPVIADPPPMHVWVVADAAVIPRLRRVRSGPPRAARGAPNLYT